MKKNRVYGVILVFLMVGFSIALFSVNSAGSEYPKTSAVGDVDYDFERNVLYDGPVNITNNFNIANYSYYDGNYNATYSFKNEVGLKDDAISFIDSVQGGGSAEIISEYQGHNGVLVFGKDGSYSDLYSTEFFIVDGIVEFWVNKNDSLATRIYIQDKGIEGSIYFVLANTFLINGTNIGTYLIDVWYHFKVQWYDNSTFDLWIDGVQKVDGWYTYDYIVDGLDRIQIRHYGDGVFFDGIGYDWRGYEVGSNRFSDVYVDQVDKVIDRWEFAFEGENDFYDVGDDNPDSWTDVEDGGDDVNIVYDGGVSTYDRAVQIGSGGDQIVGIEKTVGHISKKRITTTFGFNITEWGSDSGHISFEVYSSTNQEVMHVYLSRIGGVIKLYSEGVYPASYYIYPGLVIGKYYELEIYIDYFFNMSIVLLKEDGSYVDQYYYELPLKIGGQIGCNLMKVMLETDAEDVISFELDYIGLYRDAKSGSNAWGYIEQNLDATNWNINEFNLVFLDASGLYSMSKYWTEAEINFVPEGILQEFLPYGVHTLDEGLKNVYGMTAHEGYPSLIFFIKNNFNPIDLIIEGVVMNDGEENIILQFLHGGVDIDESYFYVSGNALKWIMIVDDSGAEYITANFDINNVACENRTFGFISDTTGSSYADLQLFYTDLTSVYFELPFYYLATKIILPQEKMINRITLYVYDNDEFDAGAYIGYIKDIELMTYTDIILTIGVINLLGIITPIIIMIVPPLAMSRRFGNKAIIPMFILMTVICFITSLIPAWLFFVIAFGLVSFIFMKRKRGAKK